MKKQLNSFSQKPVTKLGWWVFGLGMAVLVVLMILALFPLVLGTLINSQGIEDPGSMTGISLGLPLRVFTLAGLVCFGLALFKGERSWVMFAGLIPILIYIILSLSDLLRIS